jgi:uncharacterized membrane protein
VKLPSGIYSFSVEEIDKKTTSSISKTQYQPIKINTISVSYEPESINELFAFRAKQYSLVESIGCLVKPLEIHEKLGESYSFNVKRSKIFSGIVDAFYL